MVIDYQRVKTLVKDFSLKFFFGQIVLFNIFFEKLFLYLSWCFSWGSCISWVFSWIFTWIFLISLILFEWIFNNLWHHQNDLVWGVFPIWSHLSFFHILQIFHEMKASSSSLESSLDSSLEELSTLRALDELLETCSLDDEVFLLF